MTKAIATIIVGEKYQRLWEAVARPSWEQYANRHGYRLVVFRDVLDASPLGSHRSPAWQKLLTLGRPELKDVDRVLWLDADIIINSSAPDAVENLPIEKVGAVADQALLSSPSLATPFTVNNGWHAGPAALSRQFYASNGFAAPSNYHLNSGVWVASPRHHRELFEHIYRTNPQRPHSYMEQAAFSAQIVGGGGGTFFDGFPVQRSVAGISDRVFLVPLPSPGDAIIVHRDGAPQQFLPAFCGARGRNGRIRSKGHGRFSRFPNADRLHPTSRRGLAHGCRFAC